MSALPSYVSEAEYLAIEELSDDRAEYVDGYIRAMSGGTTNHSQLAGQAYVALWNATRATGCRVHTHDVKLRIATGARLRLYYPDVMVACAPSDENRWETEPCLVVEVLSPSTARFDAVEKLTAYLSIASLKAYVMVDGEGGRLVVHHRDGENWRVASYERGDELTLTCPVLTARAEDWLPPESPADEPGEP
jgi:Uma2 family endonuclease